MFFYDFGKKPGKDGLRKVERGLQKQTFPVGMPTYEKYMEFCRNCMEPLYAAYLVNDYESAQQIVENGRNLFPEDIRRNDESEKYFMDEVMKFAGNSRGDYGFYISCLLYDEKQFSERSKLFAPLNFSHFTANEQAFDIYPDLTGEGNLFTKYVLKLHAHPEKKREILKQLQRFPATTGTGILKAALETDSVGDIYVNVLKCIAAENTRNHALFAYLADKDIKGLLNSLEKHSTTDLATALTGDVAEFYRKLKGLKVFPPKPKKTPEQAHQEKLKAEYSYSNLKKLVTEFSKSAESDPEKTTADIRRMKKEFEFIYPDRKYYSIIQNSWFGSMTIPLAICLGKAAEQENDLQFSERLGSCLYRLVKDLDEENLKAAGYLPGEKEKEVEAKYKTITQVLSYGSSPNIFRRDLFTCIRYMDKDQLKSLSSLLQQSAENSISLKELIIICEALFQHKNRQYDQTTEILMSFYSDLFGNKRVSGVEIFLIVSFLEDFFNASDQQGFLIPYALEAFLAMPEDTFLPLEYWRTLVNGLQLSEYEIPDEMLLPLIQRTEKQIEKDKTGTVYFKLDTKAILEFALLAEKYGLSDITRKWLDENKLEILICPGTYISLLPFGYEDWVIENLPKNLPDIKLSLIKRYGVTKEEREAADALLENRFGGDLAFTLKLFYSFFPNAGKSPNSTSTSPRMRKRWNKLGKSLVARHFQNQELKEICLKIAMLRCDPEILSPLLAEKTKGETLQSVLENNPDNFSLFINHQKALIKASKLEEYFAALAYEGNRGSKDGKKIRGLIYSIDNSVYKKEFNHLSTEDMQKIISGTLSLFRFTSKSYYANDVQMLKLFDLWYLINFMNGKPEKENDVIFSVVPEKYRRSQTIFEPYTRKFYFSFLDPEAGEEELKDTLEMYLAFVYLSKYSEKVKTQDELLLRLAKETPYKSDPDKWLVFAAEFMAEHDLKEKLEPYKIQFNKIKDDDLKVRALKTLE